MNAIVAWNLLREPDSFGQRLIRMERSYGHQVRIIAV